MTGFTFIGPEKVGLTNQKRSRGRPVGSKAAPETLKCRINITLDAEHQAIARLAGNGNLSAGLRKILGGWMEVNLPKLEALAKS